MKTPLTYQDRILRSAAAALSLLAALLLVSPDARAAGTAAGTVITSTASVDAVIAGVPVSTSATVALTVAERLDLTSTWQDAAPVTALPGQANAVTTFLLTNIGNGADAYTLAATGIGIGGDQFDPLVTAIYLDANGNSSYDPGTDTLYTTGTGTIPADGFRTVFVLSTIPAGTLNAGDLGIIALTATSATGTGPAGTFLPGAGDSGSDAVIGTAQGIQTVTGTYVVGDAPEVSVLKSAVVSDPYGGSRPQPGATVSYTLTVVMTGPGTATGIVITDAVPANTTYRPGTLLLNGASLTDGVDADAGDVGGTTPSTVTVLLGDMTSATPAQTITFEVSID